MIRGTLSEDDFLQAQTLHQARFARRIWIAVPVMAFAGGVAYLLSVDFLGLLLLATAAGCVIGQLVSKPLVRRNARRQFRQAAVFREEFTYTWDSEILRGSCVLGESRRPWKSYIKAAESKDVFLVYHTDQMFEVLPKKWFRDEAQIADFRQHMNSRAAGGDA